uniref:Cytochrome c oxidase subunit 2 n=1 Tax=Macridiscus multifarius TaxID=1408811 RepID=A0A516EZA7_9BIVA|nr:cytochrome c oxidase subunit II [Macridiscus multifarius]
MWYQMGFPSPGTDMACRLYCYHDTVLVVVVLVLTGVGWFLTLFLFTPLFMGGSLNRNITKNEKLEVAWTVTPFFFLCWIGYISLYNLYEMEVGDYVDYVVSVIGHQWYWEYHYILDLNNYIKSPNEVYFSSVKQYCNELLEATEKYNKMDVPSSKDMMSSLVSSHPDSFHSAYCYFLLENFFDVHKLYYSGALEHAYKTLESGAGLYTTKSTVEAALEDFRQIGEGLMNLCYTVVKSAWLDHKDKSSSSISMSSLGVLGPWESGLWELCLSGDWALRYDSYIVPEQDLSSGGNLYSHGGFRQQEVSDPCYLCCNVKNEVLVSSADVIHSWGVSELGVKVDAIPGRVSAVSVEPSLPGVFYGFCYELCGPGHSEMPICVVVLMYESLVLMMKWMVSNSEGLKGLLQSMVSHLKEEDNKDWSFVDNSGEGSLHFGKLFSSEFPDVRYFNTIVKGADCPSLLPELEGSAFSVLKEGDGDRFIKKVGDSVCSMSDESISSMGGQKFLDKVMDLVFVGLSKNTESK